MVLNKNLSSELNGFLIGVKSMPKTKKEMTTVLSENIDKKTVTQILNMKKDIDELSNTELFYLLKEAYNITENETFNPAELADVTGATNNDIDSDYEIVKGKRKKKSKDNIARLYYDFEFKKKFANTYPKSTARVIMALFRNTKVNEDKFQKDLCDFNLEELRETLKGFKTTTLRSMQNQVSTIERYIAFAQKDKNKKTLYNQINFAQELDSKAKLEGLLNKEAEENMIFERDEIFSMASYADNAQDGVILGLLFDGVSHKNEFEEITNLTKEQIDFDFNKIQLEDREITVSRETILLVKDALEQDRKYVSISGEKSRQYNIAEGNNVVRGLRGKSKVKGQIISQRILRIAEKFGYEFLNATTITYSGQLDYANKLIRQGMTVEEAIPEVLKHFGVPDNTSSQFYLKSRIEKFLEVKA